jgi:thiamine-monophosphate kinase
MRISRLGEFGLIDRIRRRLPAGHGVRIGIGDDAAWVENPLGSSLITADMLIAGVHFNLEWTSLFDLGYKALAVNLSDIAAMGGVPGYAVLSIGVPPDCAIKDFDNFYSGVRKLAAAHRVSVVGGDLSAAQVLTVSVAVIGHPPPRPIRRSGASAADDIYVTGTLGDSALALRLLRRGGMVLKGRAAAHLLSRHHRPTPRTNLGILLGKRNLATAMIDVSDGLLQDLGHICRASRIGAVVHRHELPLSRAYCKLAGEFGDTDALSGGEDYELLFCARPSSRTQIQKLSRQARLAITRIGTCTDNNRVVLQDRCGRITTIDAAGHDHFRH